MADKPVPKFTLRFHNRANHEVLGVLAKRYGVTKNQLAEEMLERELQTAALLLEDDLTGTLALLRRYRADEHLEQAIAEFAQAEADNPEPLPAHRLDATPVAKDPYGIGEVFA